MSSIWADIAAEATKAAIEYGKDVAAKDWTDAAVRVIDQARIIRLDYVDFKYEPVAALRFLSMTNLSPPFPGLVYATRDSKVGWIRQTMGGPGWEAKEVPVSTVTSVSIPLGEAALKKVSRAVPMGIRFDAGGKHVAVLFMGLIPERFVTNRLDKVLGKLPAFHGQPVGYYYNVIKYLYQQRGSLGRSRATFAFWHSFLTGKLDLEKYELGLLKKIRGTGGGDPMPGGPSVGHLCNALGIDVDESELASVTTDEELDLVRSRFEVQELLEVILGKPGTATGSSASGASIFATCDTLLRRVAGSSDPWLRASTAVAQLAKCDALISMGHPGQALAELDSFLAGAGDTGWLAARGRLAKAKALKLMNRQDEASVELSRVLDLTRLVDDTDVRALQQEAEYLQRSILDGMRKQPGSR